MKMERKKRFFIAVVFLLSAPLFIYFGISCSSSGTTETIDPAVLFSQLGNNVILPTYDQFVTRAGQLKAATGDFCQNPTLEKLKAAQSAWSSVRMPFKQSEAFLFGPVKQLGIREAVDFWPVRSTNIEEAIASTAALSSADVENLGVAAKGMPAVEYLLFDPAGGDAAILGLFTDPSTGAHRCEFLIALSENIEAKAQVLRDAWGDQGHFLQELIEAGESKTYPTISGAVSDFVNSMVFLVESIQSMKLGKPLGKKSGGSPQPEEVESFYSDRSLEDIYDNLIGLQNLFSGRGESAQGLGFAEFIRLQNPTLADQVSEQISRCLSVVQAIPPPLKKAVIDHPALVEAAYEETKKLQVLIEGQVSGVLGATITFNDNDGD